MIRSNASGCAHAQRQERLAIRVRPRSSSRRALMDGRRFLAPTLLLASLSMLGQGSKAQPDPAAAQAPHPWDQNPDGMHIYIWAGLKSHLVGQHDYPQFLADWSKLLTDHGAIVDGALHAPRAADLAHTDVVIVYKGDAGYLRSTGEDRP